MFATVPAAQKEAALALGATRWEMIRASILGYGRSGVVGAVMLGLGRAMGETIAVALVIGSVHADHAAPVHRLGTPWRRSSPTSSTSRAGTFQAALIGLGFVLFAITIVVNLVARSLIARAERAMQGGVMATVRSASGGVHRLPGQQARNRVMLGAHLD